MTIDDYSALFDEEPGYLDFARVGPIGSNVVAEQNALTHLLSHARFGTVDLLHEQDTRLRDAVAAMTGFRPDQNQAYNGARASWPRFLDSLDTLLALPDEPKALSK